MKIKSGNKQFELILLYTLINDVDITRHMCHTTFQRERKHVEKCSYFI